MRQLVSGAVTRRERTTAQSQKRHTPCDVYTLIVCETIAWAGMVTVCSATPSSTGSAHPTRTAVGRPTQGYFRLEYLSSEMCVKVPAQTGGRVPRRGDSVQKRTRRAAYTPLHLHGARRPTPLPGAGLPAGLQPASSPHHPRRPARQRPSASVFEWYCPRGGLRERSVPRAIQRAASRMHAPAPRQPAPGGADVSTHDLAGNSRAASQARARPATWPQGSSARRTSR